MSTRHPLGNALSGWMHVFLYALASGRQPVVGSGVAPRLFCGREGAFSCGVPFVNDARTLGGVRRGVVGRNAAPFSDRTTDVLAQDAAQGYQWHNVGWLSNLGGPLYVQCARRALRCVGGSSGLELLAKRARAIDDAQGRRPAVLRRLRRHQSRRGVGRRCGAPTEPKRVARME